MVLNNRYFFCVKLGLFWIYVIRRCRYSSLSVFFFSWPTQHCTACSKKIKFFFLLSKLGYFIKWRQWHYDNDPNVRITLEAINSSNCKVEKILKDSMDWISSPSVKIQIMCGKVCLRCKSKTLLGVVNKFWKQKVCWHHPAMFCLITSSKRSHQ